MFCGLSHAQGAPDNLDAGAASRNSASSSRSDDASLAPDELAYLNDLRALTSNPHRLSGTPEGRSASEYLQKRLDGLGIKHVFLLDMPVWQMHTVKCELELDGVHLPLHAMRPNVVVLPTTGPEGIVGRLTYAGRGEAVDFGARDVTGAIVVLDYDSLSGWQRAFALGARAVVFVGQGYETPASPRLSGVPSNQPRYYVTKDELRGVDLTQDRDRATLVSQIVWQQSVGRNIIARIPGTDPSFAPDRLEPESLVLAANYDSFGDVPELSPGARGAANIASLIEAARVLHAQPPKRDIWLMFLDNQAHYHQGAREVYDALEMSEERHKQLTSEHVDEQKSLSAMHALLLQRGVLLRDTPGNSATISDLRRVLAEEANFRRDDERKVSQAYRLTVSVLSAVDSEPQRKRAERAELRALLWDDIRRAFHGNTLETFIQRQRSAALQSGQARARSEAYLELVDELKSGTLSRLSRRLDELSQAILRDNQREVFRQGVGTTSSSGRQMPWVVLHASLNLSDLGPSWGAVAGDWTNQLFDWRAPRSDGDNPGYYGRVLNVLLETANSIHDLPALDRQTLADATLGFTFSPGTFVSSASVAGSYGIYNVSLMTGYDARRRDGYPADSLSNLDWRNIRRQASQAILLIKAAASEVNLSLPAVFKSLAKSKYPSYGSGQVTGDYVALQVSGSLKEDRPAVGALLALWPGNISWTTQAWMSLEHALTPAFYDPLALEPVDQTGHFRVIGLREDMYTELMTLGTLSDEQGRVAAITNQDKQSQRLTDAMRVNLTFADGYSWSTLDAAETQPNLLRVLNASSDASFRTNRALWGQLENQGFCYISDQTGNYHLKLFQPMGVAALGDFTPPRPIG